MLTAEFTFFLFSATIAILICYRTLRTMQAAKWQQFRAEETKGRYDSIGFFGCSIISYDTVEINDIESLLNSEYSRYEAILLLDGRLTPEPMQQIIKHYRLVGVNHTLPCDSTPHITNLYRSTRREYRRLVLIDCDTSNPYAAINSAINFASFDYIIPLQPRTSLLPHAIEEVAAILSDTQKHDIELIYNDTIAPCYVFQREGLILNGGLSSDISQKLPRRSILLSDTALAYPKDTHCTTHIILTIAALGIFVLACTISTLSIAICGITFTLAIAAANSILQQWRVPNCSVKTLLYQISKLLKFFRPRKFNIS